MPLRAKVDQNLLQTNDECSKVEIKLLLSLFRFGEENNESATREVLKKLPLSNIERKLQVLLSVESHRDHRILLLVKDIGFGLNCTNIALTLAQFPEVRQSSIGPLQQSHHFQWHFPGGCHRYSQRFSPQQLQCEIDSAKWYDLHWFQAWSPVWKT